MFKKLILSLLISLVLLASSLPFFARPARAQTWYDQNFFEWFVKVYDEDNPNEIFGERYTAAQVQWVIYSLPAFIIPGFLKPIARCFITRAIIPDCLGLLSYAPTQNYYAQEQNKSLFSSIFEDRPLSGVTYIKDVVRKFHLIPEAQAQQTGFGFRGLSVMRSLWSTSRDVAYFFFVIAIIVMAFMIMFRVKLSPQTVISVQSALPKIAVALILITFSYAIAGFLVDLMYLLIGIISIVIAGSGNFLSSDSVAVFNWLTKGTVSVPIFKAANIGLLGMFFYYVLLFTLVLMYFLYSGGLWEGLLADIISDRFGGLLILISLFVGFILFILVIFIMIKIAWMLIKAFASVLLLTIVAPFQIAIGIFMPGMGFGAWARSFAANLAVFPLTGLLITLAYILLIVSFNLSLGPSLPAFIRSWITPFNVTIVFAAVDGWPPLIGVGSGMVALILMLTSLAVLFLTPRAADIVKGLMTGRPLAYGTAIGEAFGAAAGGAMFLPRWAGGLGPVRAGREAISRESGAALLRGLGGQLEKRKLTTFIGERLKTVGERMIK